MKVKIIGLMGTLLFTAIWLGVPVQPATACEPWTGPGLDDGPLQSLYSINAPLQGQGNVDRSAARALLDAWNAAGQPSNFDPSPYLKYGPDCEGGINQINNAAPNGGALSQALQAAENNTAAANNNQNDND
jgi:hypothetical protein